MEKEEFEAFIYNVEQANINDLRTIYLVLASALSKCGVEKIELRFPTQGGKSIKASVSVDYQEEVENG